MIFNFSFKKSKQFVFKTIFITVWSIFFRIAIGVPNFIL